MARKTLKKQKASTWSAFSTYIRLRDAYAYYKTHPMANFGDCACCTCGRVYPYKKLQAGHFIPGRTNSILFDERGVYAQCYGCNCGKQGNGVEFFRFMQKVQGESVIDELRALRNQTRKYTVDELEEMEATYKERTESFNLE